MANDSFRYHLETQAVVGATPWHHHGEKYMLKPLRGCAGVRGVGYVLLYIAGRYHKAVPNREKIKLSSGVHPSVCLSVCL